MSHRARATPGRCHMGRSIRAKRRDQAGSPLAPSLPDLAFPDLAIAAGRRAVPYLRALKRLSKGATFTIFVKDPYWSRNKMDLIVVPEHDRLRGKNIFAALTPANRLHAWRLAAALEAPDPRIAGTAAPTRRPRPRRAEPAPSLRSQGHRGARGDCALRSRSSGKGLMLTPSRRTPPALPRSARRSLRRPAASQLRQNIFFWTGEGPNPYVAILAHADAIIVTGDSVNMVGEAVATGAPVYVYEPVGRASEDHRLSRSARRLWARSGAIWISVRQRSKIGAIRRSMRHRRSRRRSRTDIGNFGRASPLPACGERVRVRGKVIGRNVGS